MTSDRTAAPTVALAAMLALSAACWAVAVRQMSGMDMGAATDLGSFGFYIAAWVPMMAAMMLPGAVPAVLRTTRAGAAALFPLSYIAVWIVVGVAIYGLYRPHGVVVAGVLTIAAGLYELTPAKRACRRRCQMEVRSGFEFGLYCVGSSIGLMVMFAALGAMSVVWMSVVAALAFAQKLLSPRLSIDVPVALAIVALGIATALTL
jgi:predicted metal-binding membrane protein